MGKYNKSQPRQTSARYTKVLQNPDNLELVDFQGKFREGRKTNNLWLEGTEEYWRHITKTKITAPKEGFQDKKEKIGSQEINTKENANGQTTET